MRRVVLVLTSLLFVCFGATYAQMKVQNPVPRLLRSPSKKMRATSLWAK